MRNGYGERLISSYENKKSLIGSRLKEFKNVFKNGDERRIFEELVFCILTAGASARMGLNSVDAIKDIVLNAGQDRLSCRLTGVHRFPNSRAGYICHTREYLRDEFDFELKSLISSFSDRERRRDFFAEEKNIKGIWYKEASHFLRNIGFRGYAILDKHILSILFELGVIETTKPPTSRDRYFEIESKFKSLSVELGIDFDELDLLLWSEKTGEILK